MLARSLARIVARLPSPLKYRLVGVRRIYVSALRLFQPTVRVSTVAGELCWCVDDLTCQAFLLGSYERHMQDQLARFIRPGDVVFDVGAHAGFHSLLCGLLVGGAGRVFAFEPNPSNVASIRRQMKANPQLPLSIVPYAASSTVRVVKLDISRGSERGRIAEHPEKFVEAEAVTVDLLMANGEVLPPQLMKIDVEGHDIEVIKGALRTIERCKPVILCDYNTGVTIDRLRQVLNPLSYQVFIGPPLVAIPDDRSASGLPED